MTVNQVVGAVEGITIRDEGVLVGTANSIGSLNFVGPGISATASGAGSTITVAGFVSDPDGNLFAGTCAGANLDGSTACFNLLLGDDAGKQLTGGEQNIFLGKYAGKGNSSFTSTNNIAIGCGNYGGCHASSALGSTNIAIGEESLKGVTGIKNIAIGRGAGQTVSSGCYNSMFGMEAGKCLTTGKFNLFLGHCSGYGSNAITGNHNYVIGCHAGRCISSGCYNIFFGHNAAGGETVTGKNNIAIGNNTGKNISSGGYNVFFGNCAGQCNTTAGCNFAAGLFAARCRNSASGVFIGKYAGMGCDGATGAENIMLGNQAGRCSTTAANNVFLGSEVGKCVTTGGYNVIFGNRAAKCLTTGVNNIFLGKYVAGGATVTGSNNIALGDCAGCTLTDGIHNILLGACAGKGTTGADDNIIMGRSAAGCNTITGFCNIAIGPFAMKCLSSGFWNVAIGRFAGADTDSGQKNTFLGACAGNTNSGGSGNVAIGFNVELPSSSGDKQLAIGFEADRWIAGDSGFNISVNGVTATGVITATDFNSTSDAKLKTNVQIIPDPLDKIVRIDGVSFNWIKDNKPSMGVIADNIEEVLPELVSDTDPKTVNYNGLIGLLIEVVKDQQTQINSLNERLSQLE